VTSSTTRTNGSTERCTAATDRYPGIVSDTNLRIDNAYIVSALRQMYAVPLKKWEDIMPAGAE
jgi:hypothetical protein